MKIYTPEELAAIVDLHGKWLRGEVAGERANLKGANLEGANLEGANLEGANLEGANLERANLEGANLEGANLKGANLEGANLKGANLTGANLKGANLTGANLKGANLETGETLEEYLQSVVPALLAAGGKTVEQIVSAGAWECHSWDNCPMAEAFSVHSSDDVPILLRPRVEQFVWMFDQGLIPKPIILDSAATEQAGGGE